MSTLIEHSPAELDRMLHAFLQRTCAPMDDAHTADTKSHAIELRRSFGLSAGPVFLSGHQPIFYHPGILIKDCLVQALVRRHGGTAATLILDTDQGAIDFSWPARSSSVAGMVSGRSWATRRHLALARVGHVAAAQTLDQRTKAAARSAIDDCLVQLHAVLSPHAAQSARPYLLHLRETLEATDDVVEFTTAVRQFNARRMSWQVRYLRASDLIRTPAFEFFAKKIFSRPEDFRSIFNTTLHEYRAEHEIRNHAQPFPDLKEDELPFWMLAGDRRLPLTGAMLQRQGGDSRALHELLASGAILPRAVTLSLFLRMFVCDLFVHGTGGGRYDRVTERVIERFFRCHAAPHTVATATLHLQPRADYPLETRPLAEIEHDERRLRFDPVRCLPPSCALQAERRVLIRLRQSLRRTSGRYVLHGAFDPSVEPALRPSFLRRIHELLPRLYLPNENPPALLELEFRRLRRQARPHLQEKARSLGRERQRESLCRENQRTFDDRSLPFFFYDVSPLTEALKPYMQSRIDETQDVSASPHAPH